MEGQGKLALSSGPYFECHWQKGQPQKGKWGSADGKTEYEGQFKGMLWLWNSPPDWCEEV